MPANYYQLSINKTLENLRSSAKGLSEKEAQARLQEHGLNKLAAKRRIDPFHIFFSQFKNFLVIILVAAVLISLVIQHYADAVLIAVILLANAFFGFFQEFRAEKALEALKKMAILKAVVLRDGEEKVIDAQQLVPGDIILVDEGDKVPADVRLIECVNLQTNEAALTGDSVPIHKNIKPLPGVQELAERDNMAFMNTIITFGRAKAVVTATGMDTEFGKIASLLQEMKETKTPLAEKVEHLGKQLGLLVIVLAVALSALMLVMQGFSFDIFLVSVSLAVSAIPEGLPAVVTITLALGMRSMAKNQAIVRKMAAIEALGSVTVICSDKTGTLTKNEMTVTDIAFDETDVKVTGKGFALKGDFLLEGKKFEPDKNRNTAMLLKTGVLCNNAEIGEKAEEFIGDPTEIALLVAGRKAGLHKEKLNEKFLAELSFDADRKRMTSIYKNRKTKKAVAYCKGGAESVLEHCSHHLVDGKKEKLTDLKKKAILETNNALAAQGRRVLGFAYREVREKAEYTVTDTEKDLIFVGVMGMIDTLRPESKKAVGLCREAGIKVKMITGDHPDTAKAIAQELNLFSDPAKKVVTGSELEKYSDQELISIVKEASVFARVTPHHKLRIVNALKENGEIVAVTGDGVNDSPALKSAHIGVAMGITGTDVAKQVSDMIITDDDFYSIVQAVAQGRKIYANIQAFVKYLLSSNADELMVVGAATLAGLPLPLLAVQILWINLVTDGFPALALSNEPLDEAIMKEPPRDPKKGILDGLYSFIIIAGIIAAIVSMLGFFYGLETSLVKARSMVFTVSIMFELIFVFNCRKEGKTIFEMPLFSNKWLVLAVIISLLMQLAVIYTPWLQPFFHTFAFDLTDWGVIIGLSLGALVVPYAHRAYKKLAGRAK